MADKSFTTIGACPICGRPLNLVLLDRRLRERFAMYTAIPNEVCDDCRKKYLKEGVLLINPYSMAFVVLKDSAFKRIFNKPIPKAKIVFADDEVLIKLQKEGEK